MEKDLVINMKKFLIALTIFVGSLFLNGCNGSYTSMSIDNTSLYQVKVYMNDYHRTTVERGDIKHIFPSAHYPYNLQFRWIDIFGSVWAVSYPIPSPIEKIYIRNSTIKDVVIEIEIVFLNGDILKNHVIDYK